MIKQGDSGIDSKQLRSSPCSQSIELKALVRMRKAGNVSTSTCVKGMPKGEHSPQKTQRLLRVVDSFKIDFSNFTASLT